MPAVRATRPGRPGAAPPSGGRGREQAHLPALDGLRALAVSAVVLYHAGVTWARGGLLGVDVFFVLSGYLITGLLLSEKRRTGTISLRNFWIRRARRLLPALLLVLLVVVVVWRLTAPPASLPGVRSDALATLFYSANWHFAAAGQGYFASFADPSPLLHMWSLGVEEQFYLFWPLVVVAVLGWHIARRHGAQRLFVVTIAGSIASAGLMAGLALNMSGGSGDGTINWIYYGTATRIQALLIGAALVAGMHLAGRDLLGRQWRGAARSGVPELPPVWRGALTGAGIATMAVLLVVLSRVDGLSTWLYRGGFLLVAVLVTVSLASVVLVPTSPLTRVLSLAPVVWLGRISYGVYLWHWPIDLYVDGNRTGLSGTALLLVRLAVTLVVSAASYYLVEKPIRTGRLPIPQPRVVVPAAIAGLTGVLVFAPLPASSASDLTRLDSQGSTEAVPVAPTQGVSSVKEIGTPAHPMRVLLIGDSVAWSVGRGLETAAASNKGLVFTNQGVWGCGIARGGLTSYNDQPQPASCLTWPQRWQSVVKTFKPDLSVLAVGRWEIFARQHDGRWMKIGEPEFDGYLKSEFDLGVRTLESTGGRVMLATTPCYHMREKADGSQVDETAAVARFNQIVREVAAEHPGTGVLDLYSDVCPGGQFQATRDGIQLREDDGIHITAAGGRLLAPEIFGAVVSWRRAQP
jgi:peptidoglycan/LPS O-acetylase OafA/YrhL